MSGIDISAIINFHDEGPLAHASLKSAAAAKAFAERQGLRVEVIAVADKPDDATLNILSQAPGIDRLLTLAHGDPALARNSGVEVAAGKWIAFLDGDDLWGDNWLSAAHDFALKDGRDVILHPLASIYFGHESYLYLHVDMEDPDFDLLSLSMTNYWTTLSFTRRDICVAVPFPVRDAKRQIAFEDWGWHWETVSRGIIHKTVPDTVHAVRMRQVSVLRRDTAANSLAAPTQLFRGMLPLVNDVQAP